MSAVILRGRGCLPDPVGDYRPCRDLVGASRAVLASLPEESDGVRPWCPPSLDQGILESCVGWALAHAFFARQWAEGHLPVMPSPLAIWYFARAMRGEAGLNTGVAPTDGFSAVSVNGYPPYWTWTADAPWQMRPDQEAMRLAADQREVECGRLAEEGDARVEDLKLALSQRFPVPLAVQIDHAYQDNVTGYWTRDGVLPGWHMVMASHYSPDGVWTLGSYGAGHGANGYVLVPWSDVRDPERVRDAWAVRFAPEMQEAA